MSSLLSLLLLALLCGAAAASSKTSWLAPWSTDWQGTGPTHEPVVWVQEGRGYAAVGPQGLLVCYALNNGTTLWSNQWASGLASPPILVPDPSQGTPPQALVWYGNVWMPRAETWQLWIFAAEPVSGSLLWAQPLPNTTSSALYSTIGFSRLVAIPGTTNVALVWLDQTHLNGTVGSPMLRLSTWCGLTGQPAFPTLDLGFSWTWYGDQSHQPTFASTPVDTALSSSNSAILIVANGFSTILLEWVLVVPTAASSFGMWNVLLQQDLWPAQPGRDYGIRFGHSFTSLVTWDPRQQHDSQSVAWWSFHRTPTARQWIRTWSMSSCGTDPRTFPQTGGPISVSPANSLSPPTYLCAGFDNDAANVLLRVNPVAGTETAWSPDLAHFGQGSLVDASQGWVCAPLWRQSPSGGAGSGVLTCWNDRLSQVRAWWLGGDGDGVSVELYVPVPFPEPVFPVQTGAQMRLLLGQSWLVRDTLFVVWHSPFGYGMWSWSWAPASDGGASHRVAWQIVSIVLISVACIVWVSALMWYCNCCFGQSSSWRRLHQQPLLPMTAAGATMQAESQSVN